MGLCLCPTTAWAQTFTVDQSNVNFTPSLFQNISFFSPVGQEFTPTLSSLNAVDLFTESFGGAGDVSNLSVNIRQGSITGSIVGTSSTVTVFGDFSGPTRFDFPAAVPLVPGDIFVIEAAFGSGGDRGIGSSGGPASTYPGGNQILGGVPQPGNDLWFREGLTSTSIPEPCSMLGILAFGALGAVSALKHQQKSANLQQH